MSADLTPTGLLSPLGVASHLGISRSAVYRLIREGDLDVIKVRGLLKIPGESLLRYLSDNYVSKGRPLSGLGTVSAPISHREVSDD